jgi:hypothetical protein
MKITQIVRTMGNSERRPSASKTPSGSEKMMPVNEITSVTRSPPQRRVSTCGKPNTPPTSRKKATTGKTPKNKIAFNPLDGTLGMSRGTSKIAPSR